MHVIRIHCALLHDDLTLVQCRLDLHVDVLTVPGSIPSPDWDCLEPARLTRGKQLIPILWVVYCTLYDIQDIDGVVAS